MLLLDSQISEVSYQVWRDRVDAIPNRQFSSNHKLVVAHLQRIFLSESPLDGIWYFIRIGTKATPENLLGVTGLSDRTIRVVLEELCLNDLLKKMIAKGTPENMYYDTKLYVLPTEKWSPENFCLRERSLYRKRIPKCPHCLSTLEKGKYTITCKLCGSIFEEPLYEEGL